MAFVLSEALMLDGPPLTRREFIHTASVAAGGVALAASGMTAADDPSQKAILPTRKLGRTGREVSMLALGTALVHQKQSFDDAVAAIAAALDAGITYIDTARDYRSEPHVGKAIAGRRKGLFIATKTLRRDYDGAMRELEGSLKDLGTDHLELWQVHSIGHAGNGDEELAKLRKPDSVMKAMRKSRDEKVVDFIGFTGHTKPEYMLKILAAGELDFDTTLFIISAGLARQNQRGWEDDVLPAARKRDLGLIAMKVFGGGGAVGEGENRASPAELLRYVWDRGVATANVGLYSRKEVNEAVAALRDYKPPAPLEQQPARSPAEQGKGDRPAGDPPPDDRPERDPKQRGELLRRRFLDLHLPFERPGYRDVWGGRMVT